MREMKIMPKLLSSALLLLLVGVANSQWEKIPVPTTASLRGLSVVGENTVWASGTGGTVLRTVDGGKTWSVMIVPGAEKLDFRGIHAFDDRTAVIMSSGKAEDGQAHIYRTTDAGKIWKQVYEQKTPGVFFDAIAFWDQRHGIVLSDPVDNHFALFTTDDGGMTWKQVPASALPQSLPNEGAFAASNSCLTVQGAKNVWFASGGGKVARVFRSNDRGRSWSVAETPMHPANASSGIFSLAFLDAKNGIAVGGDYAHPESSDLPNVLRTADGGQTWQAGKPTEPAGVYFSSVAILAQRKKPHSQDMLAAGIKGLFAGSLSEQTPWKKEREENLNGVVYGVNGSWAIGPKGVVLRKAVQRTSK
jgi:photosystem II stability/assembly factor-like uncharacterized protein